MRVDPVVVHDGEAANHHDEYVAREIWEQFHRFYPDHAWHVTVDHESGTANVRNFMLTYKYGMELLLARWVQLTPDEKADCAKTFGGEFLERFGVRRGKYSEGDYNGLIDLARTATGA